MKRRLAVALAGLVALVALTAGGCDSPNGTRCEQDGSRLYSSKHGNFVCHDGIWVKA